jgi:phosphatidylserine/phosphatidylglycerophosphate/cardiolipin synthase-like enzyme
VVNERAEALKEELAVGLRQAQNLEQLHDAATKSGHRLGLYYSVCDGVTEAFRTTYIHSKVLAVDDRFLTVGSANLTNRSMGIDSELHVSWEALGNDRDARRLARAIRRVRVSLLAEHAGLAGTGAVRSLSRIGDLVERLDGFATRPAHGCNGTARRRRFKTRPWKWSIQRACRSIRTRPPNKRAASRWTKPRRVCWRR